MTVVRMPHRRHIPQLYRHRDLQRRISIVYIDPAEIFTGPAYTAVDIDRESAPVSQKIVIT